LPNQRRRPLIDQRLQLYIFDEWQRQAQDIAGPWPDRGEESVEEDGM
jgi:hypothetical protein